MRRLVVANATLFVFAGLAAAVSLSCSVETTRYAAPEALKGKSVPDPPGVIIGDDGTQVQERVCTPP